VLREKDFEKMSHWILVFHYRKMKTWQCTFYETQDKVHELKSCSHAGSMFVVPSINDPTVHSLIIVLRIYCIEE
jgi:hypothetical protein